MKPWYQSLTLRALVVSVVVHVLTLFGVTEELASKTVTDLIEGALPLAGLIADAIAAYGRTRAKAPLSASSSSKTTMLVLAAVLAPLVVSGMTGCTHTREAYQVAEGVDEQAYVAVEHYAALLHEAAELRSRPTTPPEAIEAMQSASAQAQPVVYRVRALRDAYAKVKNADTEEALQQAINEAVLLIADLVRAVNEARGNSR